MNPDDYLAVLRHHIEAAPRSQQTRIGPSELGHKCARRIAYKLLNAPEHPRDAAWKPTIGTAVHTWIESAFDADNLRNAAVRNHQERWLVETRVDVGEIGGVTITGSADLFDLHTGTVIDHKLVGPEQLRKYRANGPGEQYRAQAHLYGRGFVRAGHEVNDVTIAFLPRNGELRDAYLWSESYDEGVALAALERVGAISQAVTAAGVGALALIPTEDAYCGFCPYFKAGSADLAEGCPGHRNAAAPFSDLLAG